METISKPEQPLNALSPIDATDSGIKVEIRLEYLINVFWSIEVTEMGIVTDFNLLHPLNG